MNDDTEPDGLTINIGMRRYFASDRVLAALLIGLAVGTLLQIVEMYVFFSAATIGVAKVLCVAFGVGVGLHVDITDLDEDDRDLGDEDEVTT